MKIVFTGGGTAGHIFPIVAITREIRKIYSGAGLRLFYLGPKDEYSLTLLSEQGVLVKKILAGKLRRYFSFKNFLDILKIPIGILQASFWLFFLAPDLVFSKGGYGSLPVVLVARILHIPIFLHESDISPGVASRIESKYSLEIFTSFEKTEFFPKEKIICVGNPIRKEILKGSEKEAKKIFNLQEVKPIILILGGSQGAKNINEIVLEILPELVTNFEVIHQTGMRNLNQVKAEAEVMITEESLRKYYHPFAFLNENYLKNALFCCDLVVSRAGAGSIFEIAAWAKPSILIPLPSAAQNHQLKNAYAYSRMGATEVMEEKNLKPHFFLERLKHLFSRPDLLEKMSERAQNFARPKAARIIASYILEYLA